MTIPRPEYPRPQVKRQEWLCLNGEWAFKRDHGDSGFEQDFLNADYEETITVPFCLESKLSGISAVDFCNAVWYRRIVEIPQSWDGQRILLHFQAVDYDATVWVNKQQVGMHRGGFCGFDLDISKVVKAGERAEIVVRARDDHKASKPQGKQASTFENRGCSYTRTTGIWQTVWLEPVPQTYILRPRITPHVESASFTIEVPIRGSDAHAVQVRCLMNGELIGEATQSAKLQLQAQLHLSIPQEHVQHWDTENPFLYDFEINLIDADDKIIDSVASYAGLRSIAIDGKKVLINGKPVFQRLVLDQGYYADGIMTAPTDDALIKDIQLSMEAGFNGARLHQKVFEERFLYHADRLGYLVWGEFGDWAGNTVNRGHTDWSATYITQWLEILERDYNHPSIIGWCPLNETHSFEHQVIDGLNDVTLGMYKACKLVDGTRPALDVSGYCHRVAFADIYDSHDYDQNPETFTQRHCGLAHDLPYINHGETTQSVAYEGQPYFVSEFGGTWWNAQKMQHQGNKTAESWGYGQRVENIEEFYQRFDGLCTALLQNPDMFGYCYTQLTDVFQEENGIFGFDRSLKFDMQRIHDIQQQVAAIESGAAT